MTVIVTVTGDLLWHIRLHRRDIAIGVIGSLISGWLFAKLGIAAVGCIRISDRRAG